MNSTASVDSVFSGLNWKHVSIISIYSIRFSVRTGSGLVFLLVLLLTGLFIASSFITPVEALVKEAKKNPSVEMTSQEIVKEIASSQIVINAVKWITSGDDDQVNYLLKEKPALLSVVLIFLLIFQPFIVAFGAFNQTSGDIASKGLRYLLLRTERANIFIGRFIGTVLYTLVVLVILVAIISVYIGLSMKVYSFGELVLMSIQGLIALILISLPYIALCAIVSCLIDSSFGSLVLCQLVIGFPPIFLILVNNMLRGSCNWINLLQPWGWKNDLLHVNSAKVLLAGGVMIGFTLLFIYLGMKIFQKRDL